MKLKDKLNINLLMPLVLVGIGVAIALQIYIFLNYRDVKQSQKLITVNPTSKPHVSENVIALGRVQPKNKIISLSGSSSLQYVRVSQIFVKEGDKVKRGQVIAILDSLTKLQAALQQTKLKAQVSQAELNKVKSGDAKKAEITAQQAQIANLKAQFQGQIATQKAKIARLNAEFKNAQTEYLRYKNLYDAGAIAASEIDTKRLNVATYQEQINEETSTLNQILSTFPKQISEGEANLEKLKEVRPEDVQVSQLEFAQAKAAVLEAEADLELAYVKSPIDGTVLKIHTYAGEGISNNGIVDLAQTKDMYVMAEVYETEIGKIKLGQKATISSSSLTKKLYGIVEQIGFQVGQKQVFNGDKTLDVDARVVQVKIRLNPLDSEQAAKLINLQVETKIKIN
ncbi:MULTISPECIES: ABC exporter membrane fusion protein [unclassified Nostoc]|uniref:ABC exporter membrane fusion protein n=1 Tax=unclassified Nostoc TaxID=2593658 RepID=UPI002AD3C339|nr:ABC exporter membrane fusion protein [Nostoc sp. DedQUE03]MDZ7977635.1 ABC exporter membrane fusion protein [Nostoc sp. DedQUE03]MDZ8049262.1 ABC exporter membrane fusion protein [Nostoc sp. DedQUE02]